MLEAGTGVMRLEVRRPEQVQAPVRLPERPEQVRVRLRVLEQDNSRELERELEREQAQVPEQGRALSCYGCLSLFGQHPELAPPSCPRRRCCRTRRTRCLALRCR